MFDEDAALLLTGICIFGAVISGLLFIAFARITVGKLDRNPETKHELGADAISGWRVLNVAESLILPRRLVRKMKGGQLGFMFSDPDLLYQHTSLMDRLLAHLFFWPSLMTFLAALLLIFVG